MRHQAGMDIVGTIGNIKVAKVGKKSTIKATFGIGITKYKKVGSQFEKQPTFWLNCIAWGDTASAIEGIARGATVSAKGDFTVEVLPANEKYPEPKKMQTIWIREIEVLEDKRNGGGGQDEDESEEEEVDF